MKSTCALKKFQIEGLFGKYNVDLEFKNNINIYVGENGIGKTTILNCIYYTLSGKFKKLVDINFDKIYFEIGNISASITKRDIDTYYKVLDNNYFIKDRIIEDIKFIKSVPGIKDTYKTIDELRSSLPSIETTKILDRLEHFIPSESLISLINRNNIMEIQHRLSSLDTHNILYFPTYRRIEEDLFSILKPSSYDIEEKRASRRIKSISEDIENIADNTSLIQFGMHDVEDSINKTLQEITDLAASGFREFTEKLFLRIFDEAPSAPPLKYTTEEKKNLSIIVERLNLKISQEKRKNVLEYIKNSKLNDEYKKFFIKNLLDIYNSQKAYDSALRLFTETCNAYFENKKYIYNEKDISLNIQSSDGFPIQLSQLSSGEKQIVSLFSKIFLSNQQRQNIVLFDEPELSLSIFWQKRLLVDIANSNRCDFLIAVTHSPFIFENELRDYTSSLQDFIR